MSTLREQVEALRIVNASDYATRWGHGYTDALSAVLTLIPEGAVLVTEETLTEALDGMELVGEIVSAEDMATAILAKVGWIGPKQERI